jgi:hypothetical protein
MTEYQTYKAACSIHSSAPRVEYGVKAAHGVALAGV